MLVYVVGVKMVQMSVVQVVCVTVMFDCFMTARCTVLVLMSIVGSAIHSFSLLCP